MGKLLTQNNQFIMMNNNYYLQIEQGSLSMLKNKSIDGILDASCELNFKAKGLYSDSYISLAQTSCEQSSPILHKYFEQGFDQQSFSVTEFELENQEAEIEPLRFCEDYQQKWQCMKGLECDKIHKSISGIREQSKKRKKILSGVFDNMPELLICSKRRMIVRQFQLYQKF